MKKITLLLFVAALTFVGCSSDDDDKQTCDCQKLSYTYNEAMQSFEHIEGGDVFYSNNCDDQTEGGVSTDANGKHYRIVCTKK